MKKKSIKIICLLLFVSNLTWAQNANNAANEKVNAKKIAFITEKLELTSSEAQQFWPIYNEFQKERQTIIKNANSRTNFSLLSDDEVEAYIDKEIQKEEQLLNLKKAYIRKLKKVLPIRKVAMLPRAEKRFKRWMLQKIKGRG
jgi:hypothetical protein